MKISKYGKGTRIILLHGLFGTLSNWQHQIEGFSSDYLVVVPEFDFQIPKNTSGIHYLADELNSVISENNWMNIVLVGNSLGGHIALVFASKYPKLISKLVLTGSSGLFENSFGGSYPKRGNREYISERIKNTFYDPAIANDELINNVYKTVNDNSKCFNIIRMAKESQRENLREILPSIKVPALLIWGKNDPITPPEVALEFNRRLPNCDLHWIDQCCHAPMMEHPKLFNSLLNNFINCYQKSSEG